MYVYNIYIYIYIYTYIYICLTIAYRYFFFDLQHPVYFRNIVSSFSFRNLLVLSQEAGSQNDQVQVVEMASFHGG